MGLKLCYFLVLCHIVIVIGDLVPLSNSRKYYRDDNVRSSSYSTSDESQASCDNYDESISNVDGSCSDSDGSWSNSKETLNPNSSGDHTVGKPTSSSKTTSGPNYHAVKECPEGQSAITENDLSSMIKYFEKEIKIVDSINETFFDFIVSVRDKHIQNFEEFLAKFDNRPEHLKHFLEDLTKKRQLHIEPILKEIQSKLTEIKLLTFQYNKKSEQSNVYFGKLEKSKQICALNCDTESLFRRKRELMKENEEVYCDTLKEIKNKIVNALTDFKDNYTQNIHNSIVEIDQTYDTKIKEVKSQLEEGLVKEFGKTMYDIFKLADEYNHYSDILTDRNAIFNINDKLSEIRKIYLQIDFKIEEIKVSVEIYRQKCLNCGNSKNLRVQRDVMQGDLVSPSESADVLERLLQTYFIEIDNIFKEEQNNILEYLIDKFNDTDTLIKDKLNSLQPIRNEIKEYIEKEELELENIKNQAPESVLKHLRKLKNNSTMLLKQLALAQKFIDENV